MKKSRNLECLGLSDPSVHKVHGITQVYEQISVPLTTSTSGHKRGICSIFAQAVHSNPIGSPKQTHCEGEQRVPKTEYSANIETLPGARIPQRLHEKSKLTHSAGAKPQSITIESEMRTGNQSPRTATELKLKNRANDALN